MDNLKLSKAEGQANLLNVKNSWGEIDYFLLKIVLFMIRYIQIVQTTNNISLFSKKNPITYSFDAENFQPSWIKLIHIFGLVS